MSIPVSSIVTANTDPLSLADIRRIFDGKRVVIAGDSQMRAVYRDLATYLVTGHRLNAAFIAIHTDLKLTPESRSLKFFSHQILLFSQI